jgi:hypothetical protein
MHSFCIFGGAAGMHRLAQEAACPIFRETNFWTMDGWPYNRKLWHAGRRSRFLARSKDTP